MTPAPLSGRVYVDAHVLIYAFEDHERFGKPARDMLRFVTASPSIAVTSQLSLAEVLVVPIRKQDQMAIDLYEAFLMVSRRMDVVPVDARILRSAAGLRAVSSIKLADAIHVASALQAGCSKFVSEDRRIKLPATLEPISLADQLSAP